MKATAYIVDDHDLVREVVAECLTRVAGVEVCGASSSAEEALPEIEALRPALLVVDAALPGMSGLELVRDVTARFPGTACIVLTGKSSPSLRRRAHAAGSRAFVLKNDPDELIAAVRRILAEKNADAESGATPAR